MGYRRVIPRDLFNEAKLLKCLGQLSLLLHEGKGVRWPLTLEHDDPEGGFRIDQCPDDGSFFCENVKLYLKDCHLPLSAPLNSREPYPLTYTDDTLGEIEVFNNDGSLSREFERWLDAACPSGKESDS